MPTYKKRPNFFDTDEGAAIKTSLKSMEADAAFKTESSYSANAVLYPNNLIPFVDKHMEYLRNHPGTDPLHYISNLRLMTRIK